MNIHKLEALVEYYYTQYQQKSYTPEERAQLREALTLTKGGLMPPTLSKIPPLKQEAKVLAWVREVRAHLKTWHPHWRQSYPRLSAKDRDRLDHQKAKEMEEYKEKFTIHMKKSLRIENFSSMWEKVYSSMPRHPRDLWRLQEEEDFE